MNRADVYGAFSRLLLPREGDPDPEALLAAIPDAGRLQALLPCSLRGEHMRVFGPSLFAEAPPYETQFGTAHIFMQSQQLADIGGFYRAFGLKSPTVERLDHLAVELEFMQFLAVKEACAVDSDRADEAQVCRDAQKTFLQDHLGRWIQAFAVRLEKAAVGFYAVLGKAIADWVEAECRRFRVEPTMVNPTEVRAPDAEAEDASPCGSCDLADFQ